LAEFIVLKKKIGREILFSWKEDFRRIAFVCNFFFSETIFFQFKRNFQLKNIFYKVKTFLGKNILQRHFKI